MLPSSLHPSYSRSGSHFFILLCEHVLNTITVPVCGGAVGADGTLFALVFASLVAIFSLRRCTGSPLGPISFLFAFVFQEDELEEVHEEAAQQGQSEQIAREEKINTHFICLT